ncbi:MAG: polyphosphate--glucose phosphotransferase [Acidimicrobiia bacterium]
MGIDIGGTGIKGAPVDVDQGALAAPRFRVLTPQPSTPDAVADAVATVVDHFGWQGRVGCTFPAVVKAGVTLTAANVDAGWVGTDADTLLTARLGMPVFMLNDADAAGLAEMRFGAGKGRRGLVMMITLGTGIGCGLFYDGVLVPNCELGHLEMGGVEAEDLAAESVRQRDDLSWKKYGSRLSSYLQALDALLWPDLFILGGGASAKADKLMGHIECRPEVAVAALRNEAGIVGAAVAASAGAGTA